jgi:quinol monooxygenase YgiN
MIVITGSAEIRTDMRAQAIELGVSPSTRSRAEPGCLAHNCHVDAENENRIVFLEFWSDLASVEAHFSLPGSRQFVRDLTAMAITAPDIQILQAEPVRPA